MVIITDLKEVLGIDLEDISQDHYLQNLINRASFRISSACNRQLKYSELIEYFNCNNSNMLYLKNWPVWKILKLQEFNSETGEYMDLISGSGDTIENSVYIYKGRNSGLIRLRKNYTFGKVNTDISRSNYSIRVKYKAGYKNFTGTGTISGKADTVEISGSGTVFDIEFKTGDRLVTGNDEYTVSEIVSDTSLNLSSNIVSSFEEKSFRICNVPPDLAEAVLMLAAGSYLIKKYEAYGMDQKTENILSVSFNRLQEVVESSNLTPNVKMKFKEFDLSGVVEAYRKVNV